MSRITIGPSKTWSAPASSATPFGMVHVERKFYAPARHRRSKYREFARVWEYTSIGYLRAHEDIFAPRPTASKPLPTTLYSHVNTLGGAGAAYLATGEQPYLDILKNAYDYSRPTKTFVTGRLRPGRAATAASSSGGRSL